MLGISAEARGDATICTKVAQIMNQFEYQSYSCDTDLLQENINICRKSLPY